MPEPAPLSVDKKTVDKKRAEKVGAKGSTATPPVPKSLPVQGKVEPHSLDPVEEPLLWEGLTLNKCILVASVIALLSVTFQVLQAPCSKEGVSPGRQDTPPPPFHEVVSPKVEQVQETLTVQPTQPPQPAQPQSSMLEDSDGDEDGDDDDDSTADSNLAEPWIFKKWFGRSTPEDEAEAEDEDEAEDEAEEPTEIPEVPPAVVEVKKSREKKGERKEEKKEKKEERKAENKEERKEERKEEKSREGRAAQAERSSRREARAKDKAMGDKPSRAPRPPREPEQQPQRKRGREGKETQRERDEPRKEGWKGRPGRADGSRESPKRDWRQQKGRKPWEAAAAPGKDGTARPREGKRRN